MSDSSHTADRTMGGGTIDTSWMTALNTRVANGESLEGMLTISSLPMPWQSIVTDLLDQWPEDWVALAVIAVSLEQLSLAEHRQCRALARAVIRLREERPEIEPMMEEIEEIALSI